MFGIYTRILNYGKKFGGFCQANFYKYQRGNKSFMFNNSKYNYFIHHYNHTWKNERSIEIPIIKKILDENHGRDILEVGNVMSHYGLIHHDVLDKYEISDGVINKDVVNFKSDKKYDLIISVSTLEHVGYDEKIKDKKKVLKAIANLKKILKVKGRIVLTHPLGYNKNTDTFIEEGKISFEQVFLMLRVSTNIWKQAPLKKNLNIRYGDPFPGANGLLIGVIR